MKGARYFRMVVVEKDGRQGLAFPDGPRGSLGQDERAYRALVDRLGAGEEVEMRLRSAKRQGTQSMRYYRGVVVPDIAVACGYTDPADWQQVHESLAWKFLRIADHPELGYPRRRSTSKGEMSQAEMSAYIDTVILHAESTIPDCRIRRPHEVDLEDVYAPDYDEEAA